MVLMQGLWGQRAVSVVVRLLRGGGRAAGMGGGRSGSSNGAPGGVGGQGAGHGGGGHHQSRACSGRPKFARGAWRDTLNDGPDARRRVAAGVCAQKIAALTT